MDSFQKRTMTDRSTTQKIWMVFLISMVILVSIAYSSYQSFSSLTRSIEHLSQPNDKMILINETFQEIFEAENHIQAYILTGEKELQDRYKDQIESCRSKMQELHLMFTNDTIQQSRVDSLQTLFEIKLRYLGAFLKLKNEKEQSVFTNQALDEIQTQLNDSILTELELRKSGYFDWNSAPRETEELVLIPDDYKGVNGFFRKLLGGDNSVVDTVSVTKEEFFLIQKTQVDTSIIKDYSPDSTLIQVKSILSGIMKKEKYMQQQISKKELALLKQDQMFISNIRAIINQLRRDEQIESVQSIKQAQEIANRSIQLIVIVGVMGLLMSGVFLFLILKDTTRSLFYRKQLEKEKARVEELARVKEQFLSNMSHEIRTPLQSIQGFSELVGTTTLDEKQKKYMEGINHSNIYLSELIDSILDQSKIEAGKLELVVSKFSLIDVTKNLAAIFSQMAQDKGLDFEILLSEELKTIELIGDSLRIKQVLTNLLSNGFKFTKKGKVRLKIEGEKVDQDMQLLIEVTDTGIGIDSKSHFSVFEQFTQEPDSNTHNYSGTGLGLSIAKKLTEAMGGEVSLRSELGKGSVFTVLLTLPYQIVEQQLPKESYVASLNKIAATVMIIEDDLWNAVLLKEVVSKQVSNVEVFENGIEALTFLKENKGTVGLIFTDINMPLMDGSSFLKEVRYLKIKVPIIALTAHIKKEKLDELKNEGFSHVCGKPYKIANIESVLDLFLAAKRIMPPFETKDANASLEKNIARTPLYSGFDFSIIWEFAGREEKKFLELITSLAVNNERQLVDFNKFFQKTDVMRLTDISHQMKTTYDNLGLVSISESLESIELYNKLSQKSKLFECAKRLYPELVETHKELKVAISNLNLVLD